MRIELFLGLAVAAFALGCSEESEPDPVPPPLWESLYSACQVTGIDANAGAGAVFVGTERNGLRMYLGGGWSHFLTENSSIPSNAIRDVAIDTTGECWIATDVGVVLFHGQAFIRHTNTSTGGGLPSDDVRCLLSDGAGGMWVGTAAGAAHYDGTNWSNGYDQAAGMAADLVVCMGRDGAGNVWFGHSGAGLSRLSGTAWTVFTTTDGLLNNNVNGIDFDGSDHAWIATNGGLNRYDGAWTPYTSTNSSLPANNVRDVDVDSSDVVWVATSAGAASFNGTTWNTYTTTNGLNSNDCDVIQAGNGATARVGGLLGLNTFDGSSWTGDILGNAPMTSNTVREIGFGPDGAIWYTTNYGITIQGANNQWSAYINGNSAMAGDDCLCLYVDGDGVAWIGHGPVLLFGKGLDRFDGSGWQNWVPSSSSIPGWEVTDIAVDVSGDLWLSTWSGVSLFDRASGFTNYTSGDGLGNNIVSAVAVDGSGVVWAGTLGGLSRFDGTSSWTNYTTADGLPNNNVLDVAFAGAGIWVGTNAGGAAYATNPAGPWETHDVASGALPGNECRSIAIAADGTVYAATPQGLAVRVGTTWTHRTTANSGIVQNDLNFVNVAPDGKTVYLGTNGGGVSIYRP